MIQTIPLLYSIYKVDQSKAKVAWLPLNPGKELPGQPAVRSLGWREGVGGKGEGDLADQLWWQVDCLLVHAFVDAHMHLPA